MGSGVHIVLEGQLLRKDFLSQLSAEERGSGDVELTDKLLKENPEQIGGPQNYRIAAGFQIGRGIICVILFFELLQKRIRVKMVP